MGPTRQVLKDSGLNVNQVDKVLLVGGSTRIPAVQDEVKKLTGKEVYLGNDGDLGTLSEYHSGSPAA